MNSSSISHLLCCPHCGSKLGRLKSKGSNFLLFCKSCERVYPVIDKIFILCDDKYKNKALELRFLSSFVGKLDSNDENKLTNEIARLNNSQIESSWELEDVQFWNKEYKRRWNEKLNYTNKIRYSNWRFRLWQRKPLVQKWSDEVNSSPQILLDVGCGEGQNMLLFQNLSPVPILYIAIDMSFYALKVAQYFNSKLFSESLFILCPADNIPLKPNSVDTIICFGILHHCPHKENTLFFLDALLKKDGYLMFHEACERPICYPAFLKPHVEESVHEERVNINALENVIHKLSYQPLLLFKGHSILLSFLTRYFNKIILANERLFNLILQIDGLCVSVFGKISPKLGAGDIRGLYKKI